MKVSELRKICEQVEKDIGPEVEVCLQIRDSDGRLVDQDYCEDAFVKTYKRLILSNYQLQHKEESRPWKTGANTNQNLDI